MTKATSIPQSVFQSTRPMRGATEAIDGLVLIGAISIHAPHAGRDRSNNALLRENKNFNPRAPCGARLPPFPQTLLPQGFQSTRPMRGATTEGGPRYSRPRHFNPRAPCGARRAGYYRRISMAKFQSTRPMRGATTTLSTALLPQGFQSTRPMRGATKNAFRRADGKQFQSTRPMRGATWAEDVNGKHIQFQSTRPMRGATPTAPTPSLSRSYFNPRAPCGARPGPTGHRAGVGGISIHAPHAGRDFFNFMPIFWHRHFNPRAPCGARPCGVPCTLPPAGYFNPRAPCGARLSCSRPLARRRLFQSTRPMRGATALYWYLSG